MRAPRLAPPSAARVLLRMAAFSAKHVAARRHAARLPMAILTRH